MDSLGLKHFTVPRPQGSPSPTCSKKENIQYMAASLNAAETGMSGRINGQAVICKIRSLQRKFREADDCFGTWKQELQSENLRMNATPSMNATPAQSSARRARPKTINEMFIASFSADEKKAMISSKEQIRAFTQVLTTHTSPIQEMMQLITENKETLDAALKLVSDLLKAQKQVSAVGEEDFLPKFLSALAQHGHKVEDCPVMVQEVKDWAKIMSAKGNGQGLRWGSDKKERCAWDLRGSGKTAEGNRRGYGFSTANQDDDAGKASRRRSRSATDSESELDVQQPVTQKARFNLPRPSKSTLQTYMKQQSGTILPEAGIAREEVRSLVNAIARLGNDAGFMTVSFDKAHLAQAHPGNGCTGEGESECGSTVPGAGIDLKERQAWKNEMYAAVDLPVSDMKYVAKIHEWYKKLEEVKATLMPMLEGSKKIHQDRLDQKLKKVTTKCNSLFGSKFESFVHTYITYITYITCIHAYMHAYAHKFIHSYTHTCIHTHIHA